MLPADNSGCLEPKLRVAFALHKSESEGTSDECQDKIATSTHSVAVSDGASDAAYSQVWARLLVEQFCLTPPTSVGALDWIPAWMDTCREQWAGWEADLRRRELPWFTLEKLRAGSYATFLGLVFDKQDRSRWDAVACGDTCLFVVRDGVLLHAFPLGHASLFNSRPAVVPTRNRPHIRDFQTTAGYATAADAFYIATDALAEWCLRTLEQGGRPWAALDGVQDEAAFSAFVHSARRSGDLKDDDTTLAIVDLV